MQWFSALIPAYPDIQKRAQDELDRVVGRDRLPTLEDEINLPFCHAIIKETERCHNPFWLGTPHVASNDFTYKDKFIPKDTVVICNAYTMHHNKDRYPDPMTFNVSLLKKHSFPAAVTDRNPCSLNDTSTTTSAPPRVPLSLTPCSVTTGHSAPAAESALA